MARSPRGWCGNNNNGYLILLEQLNDLVDVKPLKQTWHVVSLGYTLTVISLSDTDICIFRLQGHSIMEGPGKNKVE